MSEPRSIELLAPARTADIGIAAIAHGADAVYIGPPAFGARQAAANSIDDIKRLVDYAHPFRARIYATLNTLLRPSELKQAEKTAAELYRAGVDALIVQDMGLLRLDLPPIQLHASTQCDIRTVEKALFLQHVGFSQLVLARELTLSEIQKICAAVSVPIEVFVHGALCVSYSGRCSASQMCMGRSANRGECAQMCRLPYSLTDSAGRVWQKDKHLLSLHDLNLSDNLPALLQAGVSSFKIEGRLKDDVYVKNIVSHYRVQIDRIISANPDQYCRASIGTSHHDFAPAPAKSFNRGFTHYFLDNRRPTDLTSPFTPKSLGEKVAVSELNAGDGVAYFHNGIYSGVRVNKVANGRIKTFGDIQVPRDAKLRRTFDRLHSEAVQRSKPRRSIGVDITINETCVTASDERHLSVSLPVHRPATGINPSLRRPNDRKKLASIFNKLGTTAYHLRAYHDFTSDTFTFSPSEVTSLRRALIEVLDTAGRINYPFQYRAAEDKDYPYPGSELNFADNVANPLSETFYRQHGVVSIEPALETSSMPTAGKVAMTCRHCILRELKMCLRDNRNPDMKMPLTLQSGHHRFRLQFNCDICEMQLIHMPYDS